jgi:endonuclease-8
VVPTAQEDGITGHLGPDLLGSDWDPAEAVRRLSDDPERPIGEALLDQRNLTGIGNVYVAEILFLRGIQPWRPVGKIRDVHKLVDLAHRMLEANKDRTQRVTTGVDRRGQQVWVYGRAGQPCRRCGSRIRRGEQGPPGQERIRFWCPVCQG